MKRKASALLLLGAVACSDAGGESAAIDEAVVRDSAGITIVENPLPPDSGGALALAAEPEVTIGVLEGAPEYQLYQAGAALRLSDGRIVVMNAGTHEIRYYSADGRYLHAMGREGEGPGEFKGLADMWRLDGDSLLVYDWDTRRVTLLDEQGRFVRTNSTQRGTEGFAYPLGMLDTNRLLMRGSVSALMRDADEGVRRDSMQFHTLSWREDGAQPEPVLRTDGGDWFLARIQNGRRSMTMFMPLLLGSTPWTTAGHGHIYQGRGERYRVDVYDDHGELRRVILRAHEPVPVTRELYDAHVRRALERIEDENRRREQAEIYGKMPRPAHLPAHGRHIVDSVGRVWVQRHDPDVGQLGENEVGTTWDVYDASGRWIAAVVVPPNVGLRDIGADYVVAMHVDEFGIEQMRLYRLIESGDGS